MQRHFDLELDDLKQKLLRMGAAVEDQIQTALRALIDRDSALAQRVIENDLRVNTFDVQIDEDSLRLLALAHLASRLNQSGLNDLARETGLTVVQVQPAKELQTR